MAAAVGGAGNSSSGTFAGSPRVTLHPLVVRVGEQALLRFTLRDSHASSSEDPYVPPFTALTVKSHAPNGSGDEEVASLGQLLVQPEGPGNGASSASSERFSMDGLNGFMLRPIVGKTAGTAVVSVVIGATELTTRVVVYASLREEGPLTMANSRLRNRMNDCWWLSLMQALIGDGSFREIVRRDELNVAAGHVCPRTDCMVCWLIKAMSLVPYDEAEKQAPPATLPSSVYKALATATTTYKDGAVDSVGLQRGRQNDIVESFDALICMTRQHRHVSNEISIGDMMWGFQREGRVSCANCAAQSIMQYTFHSITVPIGKPNALTESIESHTEDLPDFTCSGCNSVGSCTRSYNCINAPASLAFVCRRYIGFTTPEEGYLTHKDQSPLTIPLKLHVPVAPLSAAAAAAAAASDPQPNFSLHAVIFHTGESLGAGHYVALVRNALGMFILYNDAEPRQWTCISSYLEEHSGDAYMAFYTRTHIPLLDPPGGEQVNLDDSDRVGAAIADAVSKVPRTADIEADTSSAAAEALAIVTAHLAAKGAVAMLPPNSGAAKKRARADPFFNVTRLPARARTEPSFDLLRLLEPSFVIHPPSLEVACKNYVQKQVYKFRACERFHDALVVDVLSTPGCSRYLCPWHCEEANGGEACFYCKLRLQTLVAVSAAFPALLPDTDKVLRTAADDAATSASCYCTHSSADAQKHLLPFVKDALKLLCAPFSEALSALRPSLSPPFSTMLDAARWFDTASNVCAYTTPARPPTGHAAATGGDGPEDNDGTDDGAIDHTRLPSFDNVRSSFHRYGAIRCITATSRVRVFAMGHAPVNVGADGTKWLCGSGASLSVSVWGVARLHAFARYAAMLFPSRLLSFLPSSPPCSRLR